MRRKSSEDNLKDYSEGLLSWRNFSGFPNHISIFNISYSLVIIPEVQLTYSCRKLNLGEGMNIGKDPRRVKLILAAMIIFGGLVIVLTSSIVSYNNQVIGIIFYFGGGLIVVTGIALLLLWHSRTPRGKDDNK